MSKPLVVTIPHSLGKDEATRRIKEGLAWTREKYGSMVTIGQEEWADNTLNFNVSVGVGVMSQSAQGSVMVTDSDATLSVQLPWLLAKFAEKAQAIVQQQGTLLLEKK